MRTTLRGFLNIAGRALLSLVFLLSALADKIPHYGQVVARMTSEGVPAPHILLAGAIAFMLLGSLSVIVGYKARFGACLLLIFTLSGTYYFHDYWTFETPELRAEFFKTFLKNISIIGGLLLLIANGPGPMSLDNRPDDQKGNNAKNKE